MAVVEHLVYRNGIVVDDTVFQGIVFRGLVIGGQVRYFLGQFGLICISPGICDVDTQFGFELQPRCYVILQVGISYRCYVFALRGNIVGIGHGVVVVVVPFGVEGVAVVIRAVFVVNGKVGSTQNGVFVDGGSREGIVVHKREGNVGAQCKFVAQLRIEVQACRVTLQVVVDDIRLVIGIGETEKVSRTAVSARYRCTEVMADGIAGYGILPVGVISGPVSVGRIVLGIDLCVFVTVDKIEFPDGVVYAQRVRNVYRCTVA